MLKNYFSHTNLYAGVWNALNCGKVSFKEWLVILKFTIMFVASGSYFIPRVLDSDKDKKKNDKRIILRFLVPLLNERIIDSGTELYPSISLITDSRVYFRMSKNIIDDREKIKKIILAQAVSATGIEISKNIKLDTSGLVRFSFADEFGSSELIFKELSVVAEVKDPKKHDSKISEFKDDIDLLDEYFKLDLIRSAEIKGELVLGVHIVNMNNKIVIKHKTKNQILIERLSVFMRELDGVLPYGVYKSKIFWDDILIPNTNNIIQ